MTNATAELRPETFVTVVFDVEAGEGAEAGRTAITVPTEAVDREGGLREAGSRQGGRGLAVADVL